MNQKYIVAVIACIVALFLVVGIIALQAPESRIDFKITDNSGIPLKYIQIEIWKGSEEIAAAQTNDDGMNYFDLANGTYTYNVYDRANGWTREIGHPFAVRGPGIISVRLNPVNST